MTPDDFATRVARMGAEEDFALTSAEAAKYLRIISQAQLITRHYHLFAWLRGELQEFLPHEIFVSAWGDFAAWDLKLDIISELPGVRTEQLEHCRIDGLLIETHARWNDGGRRPLILDGPSTLEHLEAADTPLHDSLRAMRSILVHGVRDERGGQDSLYLALGRGPFSKGRSKDHLVQLADSLVSQVDIAFRRVAAYPLQARPEKEVRQHRASGGDGRELSVREEEILGWLCEGKTNFEIAAVLEISPYTVKNHVQRIFKKIGVSNRTQAVTKYSQVLKELRKALR